MAEEKKQIKKPATNKEEPEVKDTGMKAELMKIGGVDLISIDDAKVFLEKQEPETIFNSVAPLMQCSNHAQYWMGAILSNLKANNYQVKLNYGESKGDFIKFCETEFTLSRPTVNKYIYMYEVLDGRGIKAKDVKGISVDSLALVAKHAEAYNDEALEKLLNFARDNNFSAVQEEIIGSDKLASATHGEYKVAYFEEDHKSFKILVDKLKDHFNTSDLSKLTLNTFTEYVSQNVGHLSDLKQELKALFSRHKVDHVEQVMNLISEILGDKKE